MKMVKSRDIYSDEYEVPVSELRWRPSAYGIIVRDDKLLLVKERGLYHMPGGGVDLGEMPEAAVIREIKEETGLIASNPRLVGMLSTFFTSSHKQQHSFPEHFQSLLLYYVCDAPNNGNLSMDGLEQDEIDYGLEPEWVSLVRLDHLKLGTTVDWRPVVRKALVK